MTIKAKCPSCATRLDIGQRPRLYQRFECPDCETELEIIRMDPPLLDFVFEDSEEYYDDLVYLNDESG